MCLCRYAAASVLESLQDDGTQRQLVGPVSVVVQGRQMVVMDAETFLQMQSDLALLREQLGHLTQIIQVGIFIFPANIEKLDFFK